MKIIQNSLKWRAGVHTQSRCGRRAWLHPILGPLTGGRRHPSMPRSLQWLRAKHGSLESGPRALRVRLGCFQFVFCGQGSGGVLLLASKHVSRVPEAVRMGTALRSRCAGRGPPGEAQPPALGVAVLTEGQSPLSWESGLGGGGGGPGRRPQEGGGAGPGHPRRQQGGTLGSQRVAVGSAAAGETRRGLCSPASPEPTDGGPCLRPLDQARRPESCDPGETGVPVWKECSRPPESSRSHARVGGCGHTACRDGCRAPARNGLRLLAAGGNAQERETVASTCAVSGGRGNREAPTGRVRREGGSRDRLVPETLSVRIPRLWGLRAL